jgi:molecular chaperone GrpE
MSDSKQTVDRSQLDDEQQAQSPGADAPGAEAKHASDAPSPADAGADVDAHADQLEGGGDQATEIEGDLDELVAVAQQRDDYLALAQRTQADFENYRKRVARESALAQERGVAKLAKELLPAIDNLDRALDAAATDDPLLDGVRLVRSELSAALARLGVESFTPLGETFDPAVHEAMATVKQPAEGGAASGLVVEVYQPGYRLGESVIRPARVVVAA